jgi:hypothetical protein
MLREVILEPLHEPSIDDGTNQLTAWVAGGHDDKRYTDCETHQPAAYFHWDRYSEVDGKGLLHTEPKDRERIRFE